MPKISFNKKSNIKTNNNDKINNRYSPIIKYGIINPVVSKDLPYFDINSNLFIFKIKTFYKYYVEAAVYSEDTASYNYYILLGRSKFNENCRLCTVDQYGRCKIKVKGSLLEYILNEIKEKVNFQIKYIESTDTYDVYSII